MRDLAKGRLGTALEDDRALAPGDIASGDESYNGLVLVVAVERQQTRTAQAKDLRQIKTDARLVDPGDGAIEMRKAVCRPAGGQQYFGGKAKIILRERTNRRCLADLGIDQPGGVRDA